MLYSRVMSDHSYRRLKGVHRNEQGCTARVVNWRDQLPGISCFRYVPEFDLIHRDGCIELTQYRTHPTGLALSKRKL